MQGPVTLLGAGAPIQHDLSPGNLADALDEFQGFLTTSDITADDKICLSHASTPWSVAGPDEQPSLVLYPQTTEDVSSILKVCHRRRIPVTSFSGGTSMSGALTATRGGICVDFQRMNKILVVHKDDMDAVVQPGVMSKELNGYLAEHGLFFPPDPSPEARIGGMIAMNCSGTNAYRHGPMRQWVIGLTVVLADGTVIKTRQRPRKSSAGYELAQLMIGSEGTLGLVTEATIKLTAAPTNLHVAIAAFEDVHSAVRTSLKLTSSSTKLDAIELLDGQSLKAINISKMSPIHWEEKPTLFLKFAGPVSMVNDQINLAKSSAAENDCISFEISNEKETMDKWWHVRKSIGKAVLSFKKSPSDAAIPSDAAVPISRFADFMVRSQQMLIDAGMAGSVVGHLGDGNIHVIVVCPIEQKETGYGIISQVQRLAIEFEGTVTGEHGVGLSLRDKVVEELGEDTVGVMRTIKMALDPHCILNCDKVFRLEAPSMPEGRI